MYTILIPILYLLIYVLKGGSGLVLMGLFLRLEDEYRGDVDEDPEAGQGRDTLKRDTGRCNQMGTVLKVMLIGQI